MWRQGFTQIMRAVFCFLRNDPTEILFFSPTAVHLCWEEKSTRPGLSCIHLITFLWQSQHVKLDSMFSRPYTPRSASTVANWSLGGSVIVRTTLLCIVTFNCSIFSRFPSDQAEMEALLLYHPFSGTFRYTTTPQHISQNITSTRCQSSLTAK